NAERPHFSCFVRDSQGRLVYDQTTQWLGRSTPDFSAGERTVVTLELQMNVLQGIYTIGIDLHYHDLTCYYDRLESAASIVVTEGEGAKGIADLRCSFNFSGASDPSQISSERIRRT
ncbi:MAG TPA: Wzt carbohydrate-binding domain-containing protein, partial [Acidobacteriota bacterium]|nr:Wzt carbohydrate-binding domain-containing protein [Acidobacteriota bacterium]